MHWYNISAPVIHSNFNFNADIDECAINIDGCDQICTNTNGSFYCSCNTGYRLNVDNKTCDGTKVQCIHILLYNFVDVNECTEFLSGCDHNCINSIGSFSCSCKDGYVLHDNQRSCNGKIRFL